MISLGLVLVDLSLPWFLSQASTSWQGWFVPSQILNSTSSACLNGSGRKASPVFFTSFLSVFLSSTLAFSAPSFFSTAFSSPVSATFSVLGFSSSAAFFLVSPVSASPLWFSSMRFEIYVLCEDSIALVELTRRVVAMRPRDKIFFIVISFF